MNQNVKVTGLVLTPEIRSYLDRRMRKVEKMLAEDGAAVIDVLLERTVSHDAGEQFRAEIMVTGSKLSLRCEATEATLHSAIDALEDVAVGELRKVKGKKQHLLRRQAKRIKDWLRFSR